MKYKVNWPLDKSGKQYKTGDSVDLGKDEAEELLSLGVVSKPAVPEKSTEGTSGNTGQPGSDPAKPDGAEGGGV